MNNEQNKINPNAICGYCGQQRYKHYIEDEAYCFPDTNGDLWTNEPCDEMIADMVKEYFPEIWAKVVHKWKTDNGHERQS